MNKVIIATRGSRLALWQAEHISGLLRARHGLDVELLVLKTKGDIILDVPLSKVGGKGLFVKEIEEALLDGRADLAVHSMKDVPMELPEGLILGAVPEREHTADMLLSFSCAALDDLPRGARVGTSSLRRQAQLLILRPDLDIVSLRGNVDTRIRKLRDGEFDAIVMAAAGIRRLGLSTPFMQPLEAPAFLPAAGQGALGIELRGDRPELLALLEFLNHEPSRVCVEAERGFLAGLEGGCQVPIAAQAVLVNAQGGPHSAPAPGTDKDSDKGAGKAGTADAATAAPASVPGSLSGARIRIEGLVADPLGRRVIRKTLEGEAAEARNLGLTLAGEIKNMGGAAILHELYGADDNAHI